MYITAIILTVILIKIIIVVIKAIQVIVIIKYVVSIFENFLSTQKSCHGKKRK